MIRDGELAETCRVRREDSNEWNPVNMVIARLASSEQKDGLRDLGIFIVRGLTFEQAECAIQTAITTDEDKANVWSRRTALLQKKTDILHVAEANGKQSAVSEVFLKLFLSDLQQADPVSFCYLDPAQLLARYIRFDQPWRDDAATEAQKEVLRSRAVDRPSRPHKGGSFR
jgi:hypothetical protein